MKKPSCLTQDISQHVLLNIQFFVMKGTAVKKELKTTRLSLVQEHQRNLQFFAVKTPQ